MPVPEAVADEAVEINQPVTVRRARVVPEPIFRQEWLERGGPPAQGAVMCERDDGACVYVELPLMYAPPSRRERRMTVTSPAISTVGRAEDA